MKIDRSEAQRLKKAVFLSLLLHLLLFLGVPVVLRMWPEIQKEPEVTRYEVDIVLKAPELVEEEPVLVPEPTPTPQGVPYVRTPEDLESEKVPEEALFESDKNTLPSSERVGVGNLPLPSQDGREADSLELRTQEYTLGEQARSGAQSVPAPPTRAEVEELLKPTEPVQPTPPPTPEPTPFPTPEPDQFATLTPSPTPEISPTPEPTPDATREPSPSPDKEQEKREIVETSPPAQPPVAQIPPGQSGYQPQTEKTRIEGSLDNRGGRSSVGARATPLGKYKKIISDAIGSRWYYYTSSRMDLIQVGTVRVQFVINAQGKVTKVQVVSNNSNEFFANCSVQAIMEAKLPPIPPDVAVALEQNQLEVEYTFTVYGR